jgi:hypothetical protein
MLLLLDIPSNNSDGTHMGGKKKTKRLWPPLSLSHREKVID